MTSNDEAGLMAAMLEAWDRNCLVVLNLLRLLPPGGLEARIHESSPTVSQMFSHLHHERMISVLENAPECAGTMPTEEWLQEPSVERLAAQLHESGQRVPDAVARRVAAQKPLDRDFAHPIHLLQFLTFHEGYHHGQIKSALKSAGSPIADDEAGPLTWDVWRAR